MDSPSSIANGQLQVQSTQGDFNNIAFVIQQALAKMQTATLVRVVGCTNDGELAQFGFVDVVPLVNQIDGEGVGTPHTTIYGLPYIRIQGGSNAIIIDPEINDIGLCVFASRDITKVKNTQQQGNPGSFRTFSFSDGMYLGGMLNGIPIQYIRFGDDGISIVSPVAVKVQSPLNTLTGATMVDGTLEVTEAVTFDQGATITGDLTANGISLDTHIHSGVQSGGSDTGPPV